MDKARLFFNILRDGDFLNPRWRVYSAVFMLTEAVILFYIFYHLKDLHDLWDNVVGTDFVSFYTASLGTHAGQPVRAYDPDLHHAAEQALFGEKTPFYAFFYPPIFLLITYPLGFFPYLTAFALWIVGTGGFWLFSQWRVLPSRAALIPTLGFPAVLLNIMNGQNAFLTAGLLTLGLETLPKRPVLSGAILGGLSYKPQFLPVITLFLMAKLNGRALFGMTLSIGILILASLALFGPEAWRGFIDHVPMARDAIEQGFVSYEKFQSLFAGLRLYGVPVALAYLGQGLLILGVLAVLYRMDRNRAPWEMMKAALVLATLLFTPFMLDYDLVMLALPLAFLVRRGVVYGFLPWEKLVIASFWGVILFARSLAMYGLPIIPFLLGFLLLLILRRSVGRGGSFV